MESIFADVKVSKILKKSRIIQVLFYIESNIQKKFINRVYNILQSLLTKMFRLFSDYF